MVARMSPYLNSTQPRCSSVVSSKPLIVSVLQNVSYLTNFTVKLRLLLGWNVGGVDEEGISATAN
jgi:hypothetical protein